MHLAVTRIFASRHEQTTTLYFIKVSHWGRAYLSCSTSTLPTGYIAAILIENWGTYSNIESSLQVLLRMSCWDHLYGAFRVDSVPNEVGGRGYPSQDWRVHKVECKLLVVLGGSVRRFLR